MKAVTWHGKRDVRVDDVPDPEIEKPSDAIIRITSSGICGSDLHLYEVIGPFMSEGDVLGHEPMGIVEEVGGKIGAPTPATRFRSSSRSPAAAASCAIRVCRPSARPPRSATRGWAPPCSATPSSTARSPAARPSTAGAAGPLRPDQGSRGPARRTLRLSLRRSSHRLAGGGCAAARRGARSPSWGWGRSATWPAGCPRRLRSLAPGGSTGTSDAASSRANKVDGRRRGDRGGRRRVRRRRHLVGARRNAGACAGQGPQRLPRQGDHRSAGPEVPGPADAPAVPPAPRHGREQARAARGELDRQRRQGARRASRDAQRQALDEGGPAGSQTGRQEDQAHDRRQAVLQGDPRAGPLLEVPQRGPLRPLAARQAGRPRPPRRGRAEGDLLPARPRAHAPGPEPLAERPAATRCATRTRARGA